MALDAPAEPLHAQPRSTAGRPRESFFALFGAPLAWFVQLCAGYALATQSCYPGSERRVRLPPHLDWTRAAIAGVMIAACIIALLALAASLRAYRQSSEVLQRDPREVIALGADRTCFLSLWGIIFSAGFALASVLTFIAYFVLPRCAG
jgi:hypothetical protein